MVQIEYQNPRHIQQPRPVSCWALYYGGAFGAMVASYLIWIFLLDIWPHGRWQILQLPDMFGCDAISGIFFWAISATIYRFIASPRQSASRHFMHGIIAGLLMMTMANFMQRADDAKFSPSALLTVINFSNLLATPIFLGCLSRYYGSRIKEISRGAE